MKNKAAPDALPVESTEERLAAASCQLIAALGTGVVLRHRLLAEYVLPMFKGTTDGLFVACCGRGHHHRQHAKNTTSSVLT